MRPVAKNALAPLGLLPLIVVLFSFPTKGLHALPAPAAYPCCDTTAPKPVRVLPGTDPRRQSHPAALPFPLNYFRARDSSGRVVDLYGRPVGC